MATPRVLWLRPPKGHVSVRREQIAKHLRPRGFDILLLDATPKNLLSVLPSLAKGRYSVLIGNVRAGLYAGYPLAKLTGTPFIADVSDPITDIDDLPTPVFRALERYEEWILRRVTDAVYVPQVYRLVDSKELNGRVAPNGVDFEKFASPDPDVVQKCATILNRGGVDLERPIAIYVGVLAEGRNLTAILEAANSTDWQIVIVGEGRLSKKVQRASESAENVFFLGAFEHELIPGFLSHASAGFCLVDIERPIKIAEYGAAGLPVLGVPGKLQREFTADEILFIEPTPDGIADGLQWLDSNEERREMYAEKLRNDAQEHSWAQVADVYEAAISATTNN